MAPQPGAPPVTNRCIPIEYPVNPDCMVDDHMVPFKERGLRGKAGSAPPLDLDKGSRGLVRIPGRMGSLIVGHSGPTVGKKKELSKKFWFQMVYCEFNSMDDLLARLEDLLSDLAPLLRIHTLESHHKPLSPRSRSRSLLKKEKPRSRENPADQEEASRCC